MTMTAARREPAGCRQPPEGADPGAAPAARRSGIRRGALGLERDDRSASGADRPVPRRVRRRRVRQRRARARHSAVGQRRRTQHRRTGRVRGRTDARHVAHARRLGRSGRARGARSGRLPSRRRGRGDAAPRPCRGARVRVRHRLRGADARRRIRVPHAAVRLDERQSRVGRSRHRRRSGGPRIRTGEQRPVLGAARRRRQLRRRHELRVQASPGRSGRHRRRDCLAWRGGRRRPRDVSIVGDAGARAS